MPVTERREMIEQTDCPVSIRVQCELLGVNRSMVYYRPCGLDDSDVVIMRLLDEQYTRTPYYGVERMAAWLRRLGIRIGHNRVRRLLRQMGLQAVYPKPRLSRPAGPEHRLWPYLLRGLTIDRPNQVWAADITYIRLWRGFVYLVAVMDWYSRYVLSWVLSATLDGGFCIEALRRALAVARPQIFNTDQGSQFTSEGFTDILQQTGVAISMDGRGRAFDNIFVERLWRSVKYEEVYLKDYGVVDEARQGLRDYFTLYNSERPHQSLGYRTPAEVYFGSQAALGEPRPGLAAPAYAANVTM
jgi:putative transposase